MMNIEGDLESLTHLGPLAAFLASCTWALGSSTYARLSLVHSPFAINFTRALLALPLFFIGALSFQAEPMSFAGILTGLRLEHLGWLSLSMICSYALADAFFVWSTRSLGVPGALAIASAYPVWTALFGAFYKGEILSGLNILGLSITLGGVASVILSTPQKHSRPSETSQLQGASSRSSSLFRGVALAILTSLMWATNSASISAVGSDLSSYQMNLIRMVLALVLCFGLGALAYLRRRAQHADTRWEIVLSWRALRPFVWIFILEAFGGSLFFTYGLAHSPLVLASTLSSLAPVIAVPVSWALRLERISALRTAAVAAVVGGLALLFVK